jgi:hypothetical protein
MNTENQTQNVDHYQTIGGVKVFQPKLLQLKKHNIMYVEKPLENFYKTQKSEIKWKTKTAKTYIPDNLPDEGNLVIY